MLFAFQIVSETGMIEVTLSFMKILFAKFFAVRIGDLLVLPPRPAPGAVSCKPLVCSADRSDARLASRSPWSSLEEILYLRCVWARGRLRAGSGFGQGIA